MCIRDSPGSTIRDAVRLAEYLHEHNINPQQVQDFYPTPGTISTLSLIHISLRHICGYDFARIGTLPCGCVYRA